MTAGIFTKFAFGMEAKGDANYGTRVTAIHTLEPEAGSGIQHDLDMKETEVFTGEMAKRVCTYPGEEKSEGSFDIPFFANVIPFWMYSLMGKVTTSKYNDGMADVEGVYKHELSEDALRPGMTVEQTIGDLQTIATGVQPTQMELTIEQGEEIKTKFDVFAKALELLTDPTTSTAYLGCPMNHTHDITVEINGVSFATVKKFSLTYNNNVSAEYTITSGSKVAARGLANTEYSGSMTFIVDGSTPAEYQKYLNNTARSIKLTAKGEKIGTTEVQEQLIIDLPLVKFSNFTVDSTMETVTADVDFTGLLDRESGKHLGITVVNGVESLES